MRKIVSALTDESPASAAQNLRKLCDVSVCNLTSFITGLLSRIYNHHCCGDILDREQCQIGWIASPVADKEV